MLGNFRGGKSRALGSLDEARIRARRRDDMSADTSAADLPAEHRSKRGSYLNGQQRRDEFINGALELFAQQGFQRLSLRKIAEGLGVSHAALSYHFPTKEALLEAVFAAQAERERPIVAGVLAERGLLDFLADLIRTNEEIPGLIGLDVTILGEAHRPEHTAHEWARRRLDETNEAIRSELMLERNRGRLRAGLDLDMTARQITAMVRGLQLQWLYDRSIALDAHLSAYLDQLRS
jgi:AcrR family transcriptional regulator